MALIDQSYFIDDIYVPTLNLDSSQEARLVQYINQYEPDFMKKSLGLKFYQLFKTGLTVVSPVLPAQRWIDLRDGCIWVDRNQNQHEWLGIRNPDARYVYFYYMRSLISRTGNIGELVPQTDNSASVSRDSKLVHAWSSMRFELRKMWDMLKNSVLPADYTTLVYPEYYSDNSTGLNKNCPDYEHFLPVNSLGI